MGGPASSTANEIYRQDHEQTTISMALHPQKVWERFGDDVYSILRYCSIITSRIGAGCVSAFFVMVRDGKQRGGVSGTS